MTTKRIGGRMVLAAMLTGAVLWSAEAQACSMLLPPMPPELAMFPGETQNQYNARRSLHVQGFMAMRDKADRDGEMARQANEWASSQAVAVVEVVSIRRDVPIGPRGEYAPTGNEVRVKATGWLKGNGPRGKTITLKHTDFSSCGPLPMWGVMSAEPGQRYVMFFDGGFTQDGARESVAVSSIVAPEIIAAMAEKAR